MEIRPYAPADWPRIEAVHDAARKIELHQAGLDGAFLPLSIAAQREGLFDYTILVAQDTEVTGFVAFTQEELAWLYVGPARHRRGIGRALAQAALAQMGPGPRTVEVLAGNLPALSLYRSLGFTQEEIVHGHMPGNEDFSVTVHCLSTPEEPSEPA